MKKKQKVDLSELDWQAARKILQKKGRLTTSEAALFLGVKKRTFERWRPAGIGPFWHDFPGGCYYDVQDLLNYEVSCLRHPKESVA